MHQFELEQRRLTDDPLDLLRIVDAWKLHDDFVFSRSPTFLNYRFRYTQGIDAVFDRSHCLIHSLQAILFGSSRLYLERVGVGAFP